MIRKLPIVEILHTDFYVDVIKDELREVVHPENTIPFTAFFRRKDNYVFLYNKRTRSWVYRSWEIDLDKNNLRTVVLPALMELDPEGMAIRYDIPLEQLCPKPGAIPWTARRTVASVYPVWLADKEDSNNRIQGVFTEFLQWYDLHMEEKRTLSKK